MNKKLITLFTTLSISTVAISGAFLFKSHQDGFKKANADEKEITLIRTLLSIMKISVVVNILVLKIYPLV